MLTELLTKLNPGEPKVSKKGECFSRGQSKRLGLNKGCKIKAVWRQRALFMFHRCHCGDQWRWTYYLSPFLLLFDFSTAVIRLKASSQQYTALFQWTFPTTFRFIWRFGRIIQCLLKDENGAVTQFAAYQTRVNPFSLQNVHWILLHALHNTQNLWLYVQSQWHMNNG